MFPLQENPSILVIHKLLCMFPTLDEKMCVEPKETHNRTNNCMEHVRHIQSNNSLYTEGKTVCMISFTVDESFQPQINCYIVLFCDVCCNQRMEKYNLDNQSHHWSPQSLVNMFILFLCNKHSQKWCNLL